MPALSKKIALVTGASRGIGRATALALASGGAHVVVHYGQRADAAKAVVDEIRASGGHADAVGVDLAAPDGAHALAAEVRKLVGERLDIIATVVAMQELQRIAEPADVASVIAFLASEEARWITGDTIHVDGGSKL